MLDAILQLRGGPNGELRYAARSWAANLPHRQLVVAGGRPEWLTGVEYIPVRQDGAKYLNAWYNLQALVERPDLTDDVIVLMDDVFVTEPVEQLPRLNRGRLVDVLAEYERRHVASPYTRLMAETLRLLQSWGYADPLSHSLHAPMVVNRQRLAELMYRLERELSAWPALNVARLHWRTLYGNLHWPGSTYMADPKVYDLADRKVWPAPFVSTDDSPDYQSFERGAVGRYLRELFPDPGPYERR